MDYLSKVKALRPTKNYSEKFTQEMLDQRRYYKQQLKNQNNDYEIDIDSEYQKLDDKTKQIVDILVQRKVQQFLNINQPLLQNIIPQQNQFYQPPQFYQQPIQKPQNQVFLKTKICPHLQIGNCQAGSSCRFAHSQEELRIKPNLLKTKMCVLFEQGQCMKGDTCNFAHGQHELSQTPDFQKTAICTNWKYKGFCQHGVKCRYSHQDNRINNNIQQFNNVMNQQFFYQNQLQNQIYFGNQVQ